MPTRLYLSPFILHFITYRQLLLRNCHQIFRKPGFPLRALRKQLTSCCITLSCPQIYIPYLLFCVSSHIGHPCEEIAIKLSDNQDFLLLQHAPMPTGLHSSHYNFFCINHWSFLWRDYLQIVRQSGIPLITFKKQLTSYSGRTERDFVSIFHFWDYVITPSNLS